MLNNQFNQNSSILNRLRSVMVAIALFIVLCFFALFFSSQGLYKNLQALNQDNNLLNYSSQALESLNSTELRLPDVINRTNITELRYRFTENMKVSEKLISNAMEQTSQTDEVHQILLKINEALSHFRSSSDLTFNRLSGMELSKSTKEVDEINADLMASRQYLLDAKELLRKVQIVIQQRNDKIFNTIYKNRFKPLLVAVFLSTLFFTFVLTFGLSLSRKIGRSISNLLEATDKVANGNLDYQARVLHFDEIGRLTDAFNKMITSLKTGQDELSLAIERTNGLQNITAAFSEALTPEQVFDVVFEKAYKTLKALYGAVVMVSEDGNSLEIRRTIGLDQSIIDKWKTFPINSDLPVAECVRYAKPIFIKNSDMDVKKYKDLEKTDFNKKNEQIHVYLPLTIGSEVLGALTLTFKRAEDFDTPEKEFMLALARQCSQAIHRSELYDDARKAIEARDEFLSIASHELRTPLTPLKLQLQGLERHIMRGTLSDLPAEKVVKIIQTSDRQINRLSTLIDDLLDVSRITTGKLSLNKETFSVSEMINEVVIQYSQQLKTSQSNLHVTILEDSQGNWDKVRIEQVIINLLTNAAKYAPNKPIHITVGKTKGHVQIKVRDEGPGIAPEDQERIFKRFERVNSKNNVGGLGLGLYISKQIVEAHKGSITVSSTLGEGSTFTVDLPQEFH